MRQCRNKVGILSGIYNKTKLQLLKIILTRAIIRHLVFYLANSLEKAIDLDGYWDDLK